MKFNMVKRVRNVWEQAYVRFPDIWSLTLFSDDVDSQCWSDYEDMAQALKYVKT